MTRRPRHTRVRVLVTLVMVLGLVTACTGQTPDTATGPDQQIARFIASWQDLDPAAAADLTTDPSAAALVLGEVTNNLRPDSLTITAGAVDRTGDDKATTTATFSWVLPDAGTWTYPVSWTWERKSANADWLLDWSPAIVHPKLGERQTLAAKSSAPQEGVLVDRNNNQIVAPVRVYSVVLMPAQVDVGTTAAALAPVLSTVDPTITADSIVAGATAALTQATAAPSADPSGADPSGSDGSAATATPSAGGSAAPSTAPATDPAATDPAKVGYTVINLREPDYLKIKPQLDQIPGLTFPSEVRNLPPTRDFAHALLPQVTPVADKLMTGTAGWSVITVDTTGGVLEVLEDHPAVAGQHVTLTLDSNLQQAAEAAIADQTQPAVVLAMQPSTGEILAVGQNAAANAQGSLALTGQYPPGSTFKVVTATAALDRGLITPGQPVDCPGSVEFGGRVIHNSHDFALGTVDSTLAFARSCNTTFAALSTQMPADALTTAATDYGIGLDFVVDGITTLTGKAPAAESVVQRAENGFGQGQILITPFSALMMAATAANGAMPMPVLIRGSTTTVDKPAPVRSAAVQDGVRTYMKAVVDEGTGAGLEGFGDVHAKTGTAEFAAADGTIHAHAWTVGYKGDLAFAALVVGGEDSIVTNNVIAKFLSAVPQ